MGSRVHPSHGFTGRVMVLLLDNVLLAETVRVTLNHGRYITPQARNVAEAREIVADWEPNVAVLDMLEHGQEVAAVTRTPATAALPEGAHLVGGDPSRPKTLASALRGLKTVLLSPRVLGRADGGRNGADGDPTAELLALLSEHGVQRVVVLSPVTV